MDRVTSINQTIKTARLQGLDGLRALACLAVIAHHFSQRLSMEFLPVWAIELQAFALMGNVGVTIFFVLSGFLLSYPFWKNYYSYRNIPNFKQYLLRRNARIIPGFYLSIITATILVSILHINSDYLWIRFFAGITFTSGFHYITLFPSAINGPYWSISFEVFSYFLMPLFMIILYQTTNKKRTLKKALIYWMIVFIFIIFCNQLIHVFLTPNDIDKGWQYGLIGGAKYWMPNYNPVGFFGHFIFGILSCGISVHIFNHADKFEKAKNKYLFDIISLIAFIGSLLLLWYCRYLPEFSFSIQNQPYFFPYYTTLIALTLTCLPHTKFFARILDNKFFKYTAKISFGLYIWHYMIIELVALIRKDYVYMGMTDWKQWLAISTVVLIISYIIATLSYYFVEKPALELSHRKKRS